MTNREELGGHAISTSTIGSNARGDRRWSNDDESCKVSESLVMLQDGAKEMLSRKNQRRWISNWFSSTIESHATAHLDQGTV
jgi:hypothetical protein